MLKGFASLHAGLVARRDRPSQPTEAPVEFNIDDIPPAPPAPRLVTSDGENLTPSASLTGNLITAGRQAYRAEQQRQSEKLATPSLPDNVVDSLPAFLKDPAPPVRDAAGADDIMPRHPSDDDLASVRAKLAHVPEPAIEDSADPTSRQRRRAVTLRLRPEQHASLLAVRRQLGCSFQVLVVRALADFLTALERTGAGNVADGAGAHLNAGSARLAQYSLQSATEGASAEEQKLLPNVHLFALPSGWCIAAWRQERGAAAATPSEVLGMVLREQGVSDLLVGGDDALPDAALESMTFGDRGHRLALTIRLDPDMHRRLIDARARLGHTGQEILLCSIAAFLSE